MCETGANAAARGRVQRLFVAPAGRLAGSSSSKLVCGHLAWHPTHRIPPLQVGYYYGATQFLIYLAAFVMFQLTSETIGVSLCNTVWGVLEWGGVLQPLLTPHSCAWAAQDGC